MLIAEDGGHTISNGKSAWTSGIIDVSELGVHGRSVAQEYGTTNTKWLDDATLPVSAGEDGENHRTSTKALGQIQLDTMPAAMYSWRRRLFSVPCQGANQMVRKGQTYFS